MKAKIAVKELRIQQRSQLVHHYSGEASSTFWLMVNNLPDAEQREFYSLGVALQNMESFVLQQLKNVAPNFVKEKK